MVNLLPVLIVDKWTNAETRTLRKKAGLVDVAQHSPTTSHVRVPMEGGYWFSLPCVAGDDAVVIPSGSAM